MKKSAAAIFFVFLAVSCQKAPKAPQAARPVFIASRGSSVQNGKIVYLTFDADMTPGMEHRVKTGQVKRWYDPALISYLEENRISATVFTTGMFAELYPDVIKDMGSRSQFSIQNHTYDHAAFEVPCYDLPTVKTSDAKKQEMEKTQNIIQRLTGKLPTLMRYPGLCHSITDDELVQSLGLSVSDGTFASGDAFNSNARQIVSQVLSRTKSGSEIVFHLGGPNAPATAEAIEEIVPKLKSQGFTFGKLGNG